MLVIVGVVVVLVLAACFVIFAGNIRQRSTHSAAALATAPPALAQPSAAPAATPPLATKAAPAAATAVSIAATNAPGSDPRPSIAPASPPAPPTEPALHIAPTDTNAPGSDLTGASATWDDDSKVLRIIYPRGWQPSRDQTTPSKILQGPDGTMLLLSVHDPAPGTLADEIQQERQGFDGIRNYVSPMSIRRISVSALRPG